MLILRSLVSVLVRLVRRTGSFRLRSNKLTLGIERKTVHYEQDGLKLTLQSSPTSSGSECDAQDEEPVHGSDDYGELAG